MLGIIWQISLTLGEVVHIYYFVFCLLSFFSLLSSIDMATGGGSLND